MALSCILSSRQIVTYIIVKTRTINIFNDNTTTPQNTSDNYNLPVKAFLLGILPYVIVRTQFEGEKTLMVGCDVNDHRYY